MKTAEAAECKNCKFHKSQNYHDLMWCRDCQQKNHFELKSDKMIDLEEILRRHVKTTFITLTEIKNIQSAMREACNQAIDAVQDGILEVTFVHEKQHFDKELNDVILNVKQLIK